MDAQCDVSHIEAITFRRDVEWGCMDPGRVGYAEWVLQCI